jgi:putative FmdB family regulatory protein
MPEYEFECAQCHTTFAQHQSFQEHDQHQQVKCPKCGSKDVHQLISAAFAKTAKKS